MGLSAWEAYESGNGSLGRDGRDVLILLVKGDPVKDNADDIVTIMKFAVPFFGVTTKMGNVISEFERERIAPGVWQISGIYRSPTETRLTGDGAFSFSTTGGSQHITCSKQTVNTYAAAGKTAPNFNNAINVDGNNNVQGVDIHVAQFNFRITSYVSPSNMTAALVNSLYQNTGNVNTAAVTFNVDGIQLQFQAGELLYLGADGSKRKGFADWEVTTEWAASPNLKNLTVGSITGIQKNGWDYLWVYYGPGVDATANALVTSPVAVYVERVYGQADHTTIAQPNVAGVTAGGMTWAAPAGGGGLDAVATGLSSNL